MRDLLLPPQGWTHWISIRSLVVIIVKEITNIPKINSFISFYTKLVPKKAASPKLPQLKTPQRTRKLVPKACRQQQWTRTAFRRAPHSYDTLPIESPKFSQDSACNGISTDQAEVAISHGLNAFLERIFPRGGWYAANEATVHTQVQKKD